MIFKILQMAIPFVWFGVIGAISFIEAPLKFQAPGITLPLGLGIGRLVFGVLNKIEIAFAVVLIFSIFMNTPKGSFSKVALSVIVLLLFLETVWLLPVLDVRAQQVMDGTSEPFSNLHLVYIGFDAVKFILLGGLGFSLLKQNVRVN